MTGQCPKCYILPNFKEIGPLVPEEKIFERFFTDIALLYRCGSHLDQVSSIMLINVRFYIPKSLHKKFGKNGPVLSAKSGFYFHMSMTLGQGQK